MRRCVLFALLCAVGAAAGAAGGAAAAAAGVPPGYARVPGGVLVHKSCVHHRRGPADAEPCPHPTLRFPAAGADAAIVDVMAGAPRRARYDGYVMSAKPTAVTDKIQSWTVEWAVPPAPPAPSGMVYLFPGLQGNAGSGSLILQPVLQYGVDPTGCCYGGEYWAFVSYFVTTGGKVLCGDELKVTAGDRLLGNMTREADGGWGVYSTAVATGATSSVAVPAADVPGPPANGMISLEMYGSKDCGSYPGAAATFERNVFNGEVDTGHWSKRFSLFDCGEAIEFGSDNVTLIYHN